MLLLITFPKNVLNYNSKYIIQRTVIWTQIYQTDRFCMKENFVKKYGVENITKSNLVVNVLPRLRQGVFKKNSSVWMSKLKRFGWIQSLVLIPRNIFGPRVPDLFAYPAPNSLIPTYFWALTRACLDYIYKYLSSINRLQVMHISQSQHVFTYFKIQNQT